MVRRLFYILFVLLAANSCLAYDFPEFSKQVENIFGVSKKAPFANALAQVDGAEVVFRDLRDWFEYVSENVSSRRAIEDGPVCTLRGQDWIEDVVRYMTDRRLVPPVKTCATRTEHSLEVDLARAFSLMNRNAEVAEKAGDAVVSTYAEVQIFWNNMTGRTTRPGVFAFKNRMYRSESQTCSLNSAAAIKMKGSWYIATGVLSESVNTLSSSRYRMTEHVQFELKSSLLMMLKPRGENSTAVAPRTERYTTWFEQDKGSARISRLTNMRFDENRALSAALDANRLAVDQANDALTDSNMVILFLPLLFAFMPAALVPDIPEACFLFYVLLTDVLSALPLVVKGIELAVIGTQTMRNAETWLIGETNSVQVAETWAATCKPDDRFRVVGLILLLIGLSVVVFGIYLEFVARQYMGEPLRRRPHPE